MLTLKIQDEKSARSKDGNGFLIVKDNPIAKAGVFDYLKSEILPDISENDDKIVKVYRSLETLINIKDSFKNKPLKYNHFWVGENGESNTADGVICENVTIDEKNLYLRADLIIYNPLLIKAIENGELVELSPAYVGEVKEQSGEFQGQKYDYIQEVGEINHLAVVENGRSGKDLKIQDTKIKMKGKIMANFKDSFLAKMRKFLDEAETETQDNEAETKDEAEKTCDDKREIIREIIAIAAKADADFEGGENEKIETIAKLAEKLAYDETSDNEAETSDETETKDNDEAEAAETESEVKAEAVAEAVAEIVPEIVKKELEKFADKQAKELKKINDAYINVSDKLGTSFNHNGMSVNDIYKFGYETLTNKSLGDKMDAMTAWTLATSQKRSFKDNSSVESKSNIKKMLERF